MLTRLSKIDTTLRQQRLSLLQQFVHQVAARDSSRFQWYTVASRLFAWVLGEFQGPSASDFLSVCGPSTVSVGNRVEEWWQQTWRQWCGQSWPVCEESWHVLIHTPAWLATSAKQASGDTIQCKFRHYQYQQFALFGDVS